MTPRAFPIVGIGASAGGLEAFVSFFEAMPADSGMAFVLVAHLDPAHVSLIPELLQKHTRMSVHQAEDETKVEPDSIYIIPPNRQLRIEGGALRLAELTPPRSANQPIDIFLSSLARDRGPAAVCIILSGTGTDGTLGLRAIKQAGGLALVQEQGSGKYPGMPRSAIATGLADHVLPPEQMPARLVEHAQRRPSREEVPLLSVGPTAADTLDEIFAVLRTQTQHDFSRYKKNTIYRRIERRMALHQIDDIEGYLHHLQHSEHEVTFLFRDLLIGVTSFFRDPEAFAALGRDALLPRLRSKARGGTIRVWVPGCASGEEAYSIGILLHECMETLRSHFTIQIFGTDLDDSAIARARNGLYPASIARDLTPERLRRYFVEEDSKYRIHQTIRDMLVFAVQNVIQDPPFSKLDLLCCRNLLIYLGSDLQDTLLPLFHYSLAPGGVLFLGSSESVGHATKLYSTIDKKWKIFRRGSSAPEGDTTPLLVLPAEAPSPERTPPSPTGITTMSEEPSTLLFVETILQQSATPPCVIIDERHDVVYVHGRTGEFLEPAEGKTSVDIVEMARPGLRKALADALRRIAIDRMEVVLEGLEIQAETGIVRANVTVRSLLDQPRIRRMMMVTFERLLAVTAPAGGASASSSAERGQTTAQLERDLRHTRQSLQNTIEELENSNEELKSANEELQSINEELQSTNEELETSKEELQSLNEESTTVNTELQSRIEELSNSNDDMKNLLDSTDVATLFLDGNLKIRRFTPRTTKIIPLIATDMDRPLTHFASSLVGVDISRLAAEVLGNLEPKGVKVSDRSGHRYLMKIRPYRTKRNVVDGVVITFEDTTEVENGILANAELLQLVNERRDADAVLRRSEQAYHTIVEHSEDWITRYDRESRHLFANRAAIAATGLSPEDYIGATPRQVGFPEPLCRAWEETLEQVFASGRSARLVFEWVGPQGRLVFDWRGIPELAPHAPDAHGASHAPEPPPVASVLGISRDITDLEGALEAMLEASGTAGSTAVADVTPEQAEP